MAEQNLPRFNSHFVLAVVAVIVSCLGGFWTIPMALASLILALRAEDLMRGAEQRTESARKSAWWAAFFGWLTIGVALLPVILIFFFGSAILAFLAAGLAAAA